MYSQSDELELFKSAYQVEKKALLTDFIMLDEVSSASFWKTYNEYQMSLSELGDRRIKLLKNYLESYDSMTDTQIDAYIKETFAIRKKRESLQSSYYKKFKKSHGTKIAAQFIQFERLIQTQIDRELYENFPLIGERF
ncbi:hypothetical protein DMZ48_18430 [Robertkochia solimangrovi]|nr:hypothetical protein DMZ48_18430 [Robertkochia solimangrovi]